MSVGSLLYRPRDRAPLHRSARGYGLSEPVAIAAVALTALAAVLRFVHISRQGFWFDEANTAQLVHFSPGRMLGQIPRSESTPPLYYCVAWIWGHIFGATEAPLRALSAVAGVATVPVAFAAGRRLVSDRVGVVAAALVACNPLLIWYSQEARSYSLLVLLASASLLTFLLAREDPTPGRLAVWVVSAALALATHYYAVLIVATEAVWLVWEFRRLRGVLVAVGVVALCGLALIPLALSQNGHNLTNWIHSAPLARRLGQLIPEFLIGFQLPAQSVLEPVACGLAGLAVLLVVWRGDRWERPAAGGAALFAIVGLILMLVLVVGGLDDLLTRNLLALWPPAAMLAAVGLGARRAGAIGLLATLALCGIGVTAAVGVDVNRDFQRPDWRGVARVLGARSGPAAAGLPRAILIQHYRDLLPLSLYVPGVKFVRAGGVRVRELDVVSFTSPPSSGFCWWGSACNLWPSRMQSAYHVPGFQRVWRRHVAQFTVLHMEAASPTVVTRAEVSRALHTTRLRNDELLVAP